MGSYRKKEKWVIAAKRADFAKIGEACGIDQVLARVIRNRGVIGEEATRAYLHDGLEALHDPSQMKGCVEAAVLLKQKIREKKKIRIIGDYDVDGVNATYLLLRGIRRCGGWADYEIPDRMKDGFGINVHLIDLAIAEGVDTIITCDNGIAAVEEIAGAKAAGLTVIVTDHHEPLFEETGNLRRLCLPPADILVNPHLPDSGYPYPKLCGAAVAWKVICALYDLCQVSREEQLELLQYAAFATVGDVMDLDGENRVLVKEGLKRLSHTKNPGLRALIRVNDLEGKELSAYHIGFVLGPCINACGRLATARRAMQLLLAQEEEEAARLAAELKELNEERKRMTQEAVEQAVQIIEQENAQADKVLVVYLSHCHESIAGIVAGRLRERYYRPVFVVTDGETSAKGSGRSIAAYSMFEEMVRCKDLFLKFGGHPMAAGFSLKKERIEEMRRRLNASCRLSEEDLLEKVVIDVAMPLDYLSESLVGQLSLLEPFGKGNEKPLFAQAKVRVCAARRIGKNRNVWKLRVGSGAGTMLDALYFGDAQAFETYLEEKFGPMRVQELLWGRGNALEMDLAYYPSVNEYMGRRTLQIIIQNYR